ncbi:MAG: hypothetical protein R2828_11940 [Saprospiraceae bacterium]
MVLDGVVLRREALEEERVSFFDKSMFVNNHGVKIGLLDETGKGGGAPRRRPGDGPAT